GAADPALARAHAGAGVELGGAHVGDAAQCAPGDVLAAAHDGVVIDGVGPVARRGEAGGERLREGDGAAPAAQQAAVRSAPGGGRACDLALDDRLVDAADAGRFAGAVHAGGGGRAQLVDHDPLVGD